MIHTTKFLPPKQFSEQLLVAIDDFPFEKTRFYQLLISRKCPLSIVQRYAHSVCHSASLFCAIIAELVDKAPNDKAKLILLNNLLEEEGIFLRRSKGLVVRPEARHPALAISFARACGISGIIDTDPLHATPATPATQLGQDYLAQGRWLESIAFLLIGQELKFATASKFINKALLDQGYKKKDLVFFSVHSKADIRHGLEALELVVENSHTSEEQQAALHAARKGASHWFDAHGGMIRKHKQTHTA